MEKNLFKEKIKNSTLLDIGGGAGEFCFLMKERGYSFDLFDYSNHRIRIGKELFEINCTYTNEKQVQHKYDILTFWQVIEHVPNPVEYLKSRIELLGNSECHIFVATPNTNSIGAKIFKRNWQQYISHHISLFSYQSIKILFERVGLEMKDYDGHRMYGCTFKDSAKSLLSNLLQRNKTKKALSTDGLCAYAYKRKH